MSSGAEADHYLPAATYMPEASFLSCWLNVGISMFSGGQKSFVSSSLMSLLPTYLISSLASRLCCNIIAASHSQEKYRP